MPGIEVTRTFPETEAQGFDRDLLRSHLSVALKEYLAALTKTTFDSRPRTICRPKDGAMWCGEINFPVYARWEPEWARSISDANGIAGFLQYAWERGEFKRTLTGPDPRRESWELFVLHDVLHHPLSKALVEAAIEEAINTERITFWHIPNSDFEFLLDELITRICDKTQKYVARCPLAWVDGKPGTIWELGEGLSLKILTERETASYLSRVHNRILWRDSISSLAMNSCVLEIIDNIDTTTLRRGDPPKTGGDIIEERIADTLDVVKWALAIAFGRSTPLIEGTITYEDILGGGLATASSGAFRREEKNQGTYYPITEQKVRAAQDLIQTAKKCLKESEDLRQAFWYWGRSCLADLDRDIILDSIIGLEHLLVPSPGESRYRFGLHGAALLSASPQEAEEKARELRKAYDRRSKVAHGKRKGKIQEARRARDDLGKAIERVMHFIEAGFLDPSSRVSVQIESRILQNAYFAR